MTAAQTPSTLALGVQPALAYSGTHACHQNHCPPPNRLPPLRSLPSCLLGRGKPSMLRNTWTECGTSKRLAASHLSRSSANSKPRCAARERVYRQLNTVPRLLLGYSPRTAPSAGGRVASARRWRGVPCGPARVRSSAASVPTILRATNRFRRGGRTRPALRLCPHWQCGTA